MSKLAARRRVGAETTDWQQSAACHGRTDIFDLAHRDSPPPADQPDYRMNAAEAYAVRICRTECDVRERCLEWALAIDDKHGVLGGMTEWQRKKIRSRNQ